MWNLLKKDTNELIYKTEIDLQTRKMELMVTKGERRGGINWELRIISYTQ